MNTTSSLASPRPRMAFIGAGRIARVLAPALQAAGCDIVAVASRTAASAQALVDALREGGGSAQVMAAQAAVDAADWVWLSVVDDAIAPTAAALRWRAGQAAVHLSGATDVATALQAAAEQGAAVAGFHPLQIFSDPVLAAQRLRGSSVAIEASDAQLRLALEALAAALGLPVLHLPPGQRALYHAGAAYAASYLLAMLDEAASVWRTLGIDEAATLRALLPLAHLTLDAAAERTLAGAQAGPIARGDAAVVSRQIDALTALGPAHAAFYRELGRRQLVLARRADKLDADALARLAGALGDPAP
ncbi:DUF2520 domain-containing protein [Sphaerotilus mobilis]|uniref:Putative short-subunit dehydrogenase-like oxidoreductase (DUF2520 family) n=1 Tax=Sphaerotilus mobilis TaxID=47994 RepID=A0A4V2EW59_9BURK|nr:DUF2520 domain-containing protein [Sphaerotilus mobilis]RZS54850.1 putative short-subunit dehydrogenase-like oxidoreductase (DUF2520 family) [Sphaerotilus mobilis]